MGQRGGLTDQLDRWIDFGWTPVSAALRLHQVLRVAEIGHCLNQPSRSGYDGVLNALRWLTRTQLNDVFD